VLAALQWLADIVVEGQRSLREEGGKDREVGAVKCGIRRSNLELQLASLVQWGAAGGSGLCWCALGELGNAGGMNPACSGLSFIVLSDLAF
jgi:hypothetical protein